METLRSSLPHFPLNKLLFINNAARFPPLRVAIVVDTALNKNKNIGTILDLPTPGMNGHFVAVSESFDTGVTPKNAEGLVRFTSKKKNHRHCYPMSVFDFICLCLVSVAVFCVIAFMTRPLHAVCILFLLPFIYTNMFTPPKKVLHELPTSATLSTLRSLSAKQ